MKLSLGWISEFVQVTEPPAEVARRLTAAGLAVETFEPAGDDTLLECEIFTNRPDCMNHYGAARELAAATGRALCPYPSDAPEDAAAPAAESIAKVSIEAPDLCGRYDARVIRGVRIGPSPGWMTTRLTALGMRPVNNVVDATNYVLWEFGHPLHAFDLATLTEKRIRVRSAARGETLVTLDGQRRTLEDGMLVIADATRAVALAGIIGGEATMVTDRTTDLLLESAWFEPTQVRRTARRLGLSTDASYRFERGADIEATTMALNRLAALIVEVAGGGVCPGVLEARPAEPARRRLRIRADRTWALLGTRRDDAEIADRLTRLQFDVSARDGGFEVEVPSHRQDIQHEVDLIEEVGRSIGYDAIPERLPDVPGVGGVARPGHRREVLLRRGLAAAGCQEAITGSFVPSAPDWGLRQRLTADEPAVEAIALENPVASDQEILRTTLLPGLLTVAAHNINRGRRDLRLFEIGRTFRRGTPPEPTHENRKHPPSPPVDERTHLGLVVTGNVRPNHWLERPREATVWDIRGILEMALAEIGLTPLFEALPPCEAIEPGCSALLLARGASGEARPVGRFGALEAAWADRFGIRQQVFVAECNLTDLHRLQPAVVRFRPLPRYPAVSRDLSLVIATTVPYAALERAILESAERCTSVQVFDRWEGKGLPDGTVGVSIHLVFQDPGRTLTSEEVSDMQNRIVEELGRRFGAALRE